jgi:asparagine synthase (glutamine-hydrolysing)
VDGDPGRLLQDGAIAKHLAGHRDVAAAAARLDGCFAAAFDRDHELFLITDRYGSVPVYVAAPWSMPVVAADTPWPVVAAAATPPALDPLSVVEMLHLGYVAGARTLLKGVQTIPPATVVHVHAGTVTEDQYWQLRYHDSQELPETYEKRLTEAFDLLADRIDAICAAQQREAVLMMSGGLDTRSLAALVATRCDSSLRCVSYGDADDPDVEAARSVASVLGVPFDREPMSYDVLDGARFDDAIRDVGATSRFTCGAGARVAPLPSSALVMAGHTGFLSSGWANMNWGIRGRDDARRMIYARHYLYERSDKLVRHATNLDPSATVRASLDETLSGFYAPGTDPLSEMHRWNQENRQRKLVFMEYRVYEHRAHWMMPLGASDVVDLFCSLPWALRLDQTLYKRVLRQLCNGKAAPLLNISRVGGSLADEHHLYRTYRTIGALQPVSGAVVTRALPAAKRYGRRQRRRPPMRTGPAPLRHWFLTDGTVRASLLDRIDAINVDVLRADGVREAVLDPRSGEWVFQLLLAGALTVQGVADEATRVWRREGNDQPLVSSAPTGLPSMI